MAERLGPDQHSPQPRSSERNLLLAQQDAKKAYELLGDGWEHVPDYRARVGFKIATAFKATGLDYKPIVEEIDKITSALTDEHQKHYLLFAKVYFDLGMGDVEGAFSTVDQMKELGYFLPQIPTMYGIIASGATDEETIKRAVNNGIEELGRGKLGRSDVQLLSRFAEIEHAIGLDQNPLLEKAKKIVEENGEEYDTGISYKYLAKSYAKCGLFNEALDLVERIRVDKPYDTKEEKLKATRSIALEQVKLGLFDEAMNAISRTQDPNSMALVAVESFKTSAQMGFGADRINNALSMIRHYELSIRKNGNAQYHQIDLASMWISIAEGQGATGVDPQPFFELAKATALQAPKEDMHETVDVFIETAKVKSKLGINPKDDLDKALMLADSIIENRRKDDIFVVARQAIAYEEIGNTAIDSGHYDFVEQIFDKYDKYSNIYADDWQDTAEDKINLLCHRAIVRSKNSI